VKSKVTISLLLLCILAGAADIYFNMPASRLGAAESGGRLPAEASVPLAEAGTRPVHPTLAASELREAGDGLFLSGDIALARRFYRLAADADDSRAALRLGETFDPAILATLMAPADLADLAQAAEWYRRARDLGSAEAGRLLHYIGQTAPVAAAGHSPAAERASASSKTVASRSIGGPAATEAPSRQSAWAGARPDRTTSGRRAASPRPASSDAEHAGLVDRGDRRLAGGDVASARLFYEHGAEAGDGAAALRLGETFDPDFLARAHLAFVTGDAKQAAYWYRQARDLGNSDAAILLDAAKPRAR
jgi:TPR repeat protein